MNITGNINDPISYTGSIEETSITGSIDSTSTLKGTITSSTEITGNINSATIDGNITTSNNIVGKLDGITADTTATVEDVEYGKLFYNADGNKVSGTYVWDFKGYKPEFISKFYDETITLEDTSYDTWSASTTDTSIKATQNITTYDGDLSTYEYLVRWIFRCDFAYLSGITKKAVPIIECSESWQTILKRPSNLVNLQASTFNGNYCITLYTAPLLNYYNTSGTNTMTYSTSYGIHPSITAHTFSNSTTDTPTITLKTPAIYVRCSSSYFATGRKTYIDSENTTIHLVGELYRIPKGATARCMYNDLVDIYNN